MAINGTDFPGIDPDAPAPSAQELKDFAARIRPTAQSLRSNVPTQLVSQADVLMSVVDRASQGRAFDPEGSGLLAAGRDIDAWMFDHCGYRKLEVTSNDGIFIGLPASVPAGPVAIRFTSRGSAEKSAFVLLFGQVRAGSTATARDIASGQANLEDVADIRAVAQPTSDQPAYTVRNLPAGSYIVSSPLGTPPNFDGGTAAVAFRVS
ncbi:hypothetical protein [Pseudofrankia inefficax]|uniref:hypothetical protein n=1 Tax=Pseudofrankia inefficax (strain DSM 45817 / CECT 9037 / DDB 130130 / EuI1c) TaxID=298654 RepID=UPI001E36EFAF|nr:hypothetical protein [Pseudofrankia inefficax]